MGIAERKEREKQKRKTDILKAAEKVFFKVNGDKATMEDVAAQAELSKGALYLYFQNKEDINYGLAEKGVLLLTKFFNKVLDQQKTGRDLLSDLGDAFVEFVEKHPKHFELILRFEVSDLSWIKKNDSPLLMEPALDILKEVLRKGQNDGTIRNDFSVEELTVILWSQMNGLMQHLLRKEKYIQKYNLEIKRIIKGHFRIIMQGIS